MLNTRGSCRWIVANTRSAPSIRPTAAVFHCLRRLLSLYQHGQSIASSPSPVTSHQFITPLASYQYYKCTISEASQQARGNGSPEAASMLPPPGSRRRFFCHLGVFGQLAPVLPGAAGHQQHRAAAAPRRAPLRRRADGIRLPSIRRDRAFARALCFGNSTPPADCLRCLSDAARTITAVCSTSRRAGIWSDRCFLAYAIGDTNASSPSMDAFRSRAIISAPVRSSLGSAAAANASESDLRKLAALARSLAPRAAANRALMLATGEATAVASNYATRSTVRVLAQCARDRTPADCQRCLEDSAREVARCCWGLDPWRGGATAAVVGFNCYLRFEVATAKVALPELIWLAMKDNLVLTVTVGIIGTIVVAAVIAIFVLNRRINNIQAQKEEIAALEADIARAKHAARQAGLAHDMMV